jgi:DNA-directed RNA polymerase subunit RPC12/RpoP
MTIDEAEDMYIDYTEPPKARTLRIDFVCLECGYEFSRSSGSRNYYIECPHCDSTDIEVE